MSDRLKGAGQVDGQLVPLKDDGRVTLKGGERFFSNPRTGESS